MCDPSGTTIADTWLPMARASTAVRSEIGHIATSDVSGSSPFAVRYERSPPPYTVSTTSLIVAPATADLMPFAEVIGREEPVDHAVGRHRTVEPGLGHAGLRLGSAAGAPQLRGGPSHPGHDSSHHASKVRGPRQVVAAARDSSSADDRHALWLPGLSRRRRRIGVGV